MNLPTFFKKILPAEEVAGLEITETAARLVLLSRQDFGLLGASQVDLGPNLVVSGEVKNIAGLTQALKTLKEKAGSNFSRHPMAILSLPSAIFYTHILEIPEVPEGNYEEAARLNAIQLSPTRLDDAYFDWQNLGVNVKTFERELLIAVAAKSKINPYLEAARHAKIELLALEPSSLGLMRLLNYFAVTAEKNSPHLIIYLSSDGINFLITKEGKPFFDSYSFWRNVEEARDGKISREDFEQILSREIDKLLNFYRTHYQEDVTQAFLLTPILKNELAQVLNQKFKIKLIGSRFPSKNNEPLSDLWAGVLGVALRGTIPRSGDTIVSLMPAGTETIYRQRRLLSFISLWGKIVVGSFFGLLLIMASVTALLFTLRENLEKAFLSLVQAPNVIQSRQLQERAALFNQAVYSAKNAEKLARTWSEQLEPILAAASLNSVEIRRLSLSASSKEIRLQGLASSRQATLAFKKALEDSQKYTRIELPISSISQGVEGVSFLMTVVLK